MLLRQAEVIFAGLWLLGSCTAPLRECMTDEACGSAKICASGKCVITPAACTLPDQCPDGETCISGVCLLPGRCINDQHCMTGSACVGGACKEESCRIIGCPPDLNCNDFTGRCQPPSCATTADCQPPLVCDPLDFVCVPVGTISSPEICNGMDDDNDNLIDEGFNIGSDCIVGVGGCERLGTIGCKTEDSTICSASAGKPEQERCDGVDNDCDGDADEDFTSLGVACAAGYGACAPGHIACSADKQGTMCIADMIWMPQPETCNGVDDDCDGEVDEDFSGIGFPCTAGLGACSMTGTTVCAPDQTATVCDAIAGVPQVESCNGVDDDCDGGIDDGLPGCVP